MLSIAILDDSKTALKDYERLIPEWLKKNNIAGNIVIATPDPKEFIRRLKEQTVNLCIMDINLNAEVNGMYIARLIRKEKIKTEIIFCTGMLDHISQAFDVDAFNFISKPINSSLEKCLIKLNKEIEDREITKSIIEIKNGNRIYYLPIDSITHFQREGAKTLILLTTGKMIETYDGLDALNARLNDSRFVQCHKSTIINRDFIEYVDIKEKCIMLKTGDQCEIGMKYYSSFSKERSSAYAV